MRPPAALRRKVLVDTGAFYAFADADDTHHHDAQAIFADLRTRGDYLLTTSLIVAETHALLLNRLSRRSALQFLHSTEEGTRLVIAWVTPSDMRRGRDIVYRYADKNYTLTDATSFAIMDRLGIPHAFTFDRNFTQYGVTVLTPG